MSIDVVSGTPLHYEARIDLEAGLARFSGTTSAWVDGSLDAVYAGPPDEPLRYRAGVSTASTPPSKTRFIVAASPRSAALARATAAAGMAAPMRTKARPRRERRKGGRARERRGRAEEPYGHDGDRPRHRRHVEPQQPGPSPGEQAADGDEHDEADVHHHDGVGRDPEDHRP